MRTKNIKKEKDMVLVTITEGTLGYMDGWKGGGMYRPVSGLNGVHLKVYELCWCVNAIKIKTPVALLCV